MIHFLFDTAIEDVEIALGEVEHRFIFLVENSDGDNYFVRADSDLIFRRLVPPRSEARQPNWQARRYSRFAPWRGE